MSGIPLPEQVQIAAPDHVQRSAQQARQRRNMLSGLAFILPFLIIYAIFLVWPTLAGFRMSFFNWTLGGTGSSNFLGLANDQELFADGAFWQALGVTLLWTLISTPIFVLIALGLALLVNRAIPARGVFRTIFFLPFVLPVSVVVLIWNWLYQPGFGLINGILEGIGLKDVPWLSDPTAAMVALIILTLWWTVGFNFVLFLAGMQQIPRELHDAARLDGAGGWARVRYVTIPLLQRFTSLIIILQVIASLQLFTQSYLLTNGGPNFATRSVVQYIYESSFTSFRMGYGSAMSYIFFIVILVVSLIQFTVLTRSERRA